MPVGSRNGEGCCPPSDRTQGGRDIGQSSDDAVVSPAGVLSGEADDERLCFGRDAGPAWRSTEFGAVELSGNESPVPGEDGIRLGDTGNLLKRGAAEALTDLSEGRSFRIGKAHAGRKVRAQDSIFSDEVLILEQEFLIDQPGDVR